MGITIDQGNFPNRSVWKTIKRFCMFVDYYAKTIGKSNPNLTPEQETQVRQRRYHLHLPHGKTEYAEIVLDPTLPEHPAPESSGSSEEGQNMSLISESTVAPPKPIVTFHPGIARSWTKSNF